MARSPAYTIAVLGVIVGQAIMLFGVYQTSGETMNTPMAIGGVIVVIAVGVLTAALFGEDSPDTDHSHH